MYPFFDGSLLFGTSIDSVKVIWPLVTMVIFAIIQIGIGSLSLLLVGTRDFTLIIILAGICSVIILLLLYKSFPILIRLIQCKTFELDT